MHAYPGELAALVPQLWDEPATVDPVFVARPVLGAHPLPPRHLLEHLLSTCYQASLLRDEDRPVRFRLIWLPPNRLQSDPLASKAGFRPMAFAGGIPFDPNELRRLAAAAHFDNSLIGARLNKRLMPEIWGLVHSGAGWIRALEGSRRAFEPWPPALIIGVIGPGHLAVCQGGFLVVRLRSGQLSTPSPSPFSAGSEDPSDKAIQEHLLKLHHQARRRAGRNWARLDPDLLRRVRLCVALRVISAMRKLGHGGTLLVLPQKLARNPDVCRRVLRLKYPIAVRESYRAFYRLLVQLLNALAAAGGSAGGPDHTVSWADYLSSTDPTVIETDEMLSEWAQFMADTSAVDGAVVLAAPSELVGFGAEISGTLPHVERVGRALNADGSKVELESTSGVGTRHRSAYRFCQELPQATAVVVSQDGGVRVVRKLRRQVTCWDLPSFGSMMV